MPRSRVGIIGDVHTQDRAVAAALAFLRGLPNLSAILCSGDLVTGDGDANEAITLLRDANVITVRGNHDRWLDKKYYLSLPNATVKKSVSKVNHSFLFGLRPTKTLETVSGPLLLCHGDDDMAGVYPGGDDDEIAWMLQKKELTIFRHIVAGHTHARMVRPTTHENGDVTTLINAGTLLPDNKPGFLACDFAAQTASVYHLSPELTIIEGQTVRLRPDLKE